MATRSDCPAVADVGARITAAARRLGVTDPVRELGGIFRNTFARPATDPAYQSNRLQKGGLPLEWSFSELDPHALRIELQPFDVGLAPEDRLRRTVAEVLPLIEAHHGDTVAAQFRAAVDRDPAERHSLGQVGAFLGLVVHPARRPQFKVYVELGSDNHGACAAEVSSRVAGLVPHLRSIAAVEGGIAERVYFLCRDGLRLLELGPLCAALGIPHRFPALLVTVLELTGGEFYLPPRSALLGIRRVGSDAELKVELVSGLAMDPKGLPGRVERLLHPGAVVPFRRWSEIVRPEAPAEIVASIVSVRVSTNASVQLSVYAAETGNQL